MIYRIHGKEPFIVAVVHGGPGAPGDVTAVAMELSKICGVLEPFQSENTIDEQREELKNTILSHCNYPITLIGHSWGAWLSLLMTAQDQQLVKKLILISSGPFEEHYAVRIMETRMNRLSEEEEYEIKKLFQWINNTTEKIDKNYFKRFEYLVNKADSFELLADANQSGNFQREIYIKIWNEAVELRNRGALLDAARKISCPVIAIHGDYDPHPLQGVVDPLSKNIKHFSFITLQKCGHYPWLEKYAREEFFDILKKQVY